MRAFYELCSKAQMCRKPEEALGFLIEAYAIIKPEIAKARAHYHPWTAMGYVETLRTVAIRCGGGYEPDANWGHPPSLGPIKAYSTNGNTSSLKRYRWNEHRERQEHWYDVACRCPSF